MKGKYLIDIIDNNLNEAKIELIVKAKTIGNKVEYVLGDITKEITVNSNKNFEVGEVVSVIWNNGFAESIYKYEGKYELKDFIPHSSINIDFMLEELEKITTDTFEDEEAIRLNDYFFKNKEFKEEFSKAIGGFGHHIYVGGLVEHTLSVVYWTTKLADKYQCKFRDIAVLAAKLHDIGKIYEYSHDGTFKSTFRGEMEGHIVIGITMIEEAFSKDEFHYSENFKNRLKGCIVQHHGRPEYGSPQNPNTEEAFMVHFADYIDATMNKIAKIKSETADNTWSEFIEELKTKLFI